MLKKVQVNLPFPMLLQNLEQVLNLGIQPEVYFSAMTLDHLSRPEVEKVSTKLRQKGLGVTFHAPFMDLNPGAVDEKIREVTLLRFSQVMDLVPRFQPQCIVFHPGYDRWRYDNQMDLWLEKSLSSWKPLVEKAEKLSVKMAIENVFEENPDPLRRLLDAVDSPLLGYCMDAGHGHLFSEIPLVEWIEVLGARLFEVHLHDNHRQADEHLPLGRGNIDFRAIFSRIQEKNLQPIYTIEPHEVEDLLPSLQALEPYFKSEIPNS